MEDFEREEVANELPTDDLPTDDLPTDEPIAEEEMAPEEEVPEEEALEEEASEDDEEEDDDEDDEDDEEEPEDKPQKPIKGPRFLPWLAAVLTMLFALPALFLALVNLDFAVPAIRGLLAEAAGDYSSAQEAYEQLYSVDMAAKSMVPGLFSGNFLLERKYAILGKLNGPLYLATASEMPPISQSFARIPRGLRALSAQCDILTKIISDAQNLLELAEGEFGSDFLLASLETVRTADKQAKAHRLYYETLVLQCTTGDPEQKQANLERIAALRADPAGEFWMYEDAALYYAHEDGDYATLAALCEARLERNRLDYGLMAAKVKSLFLAGRAEEALAAAETYIQYAEARAEIQAVKVELFYRQGEYEKAIALCDDIIGKWDRFAPLESEEDWQAAMAALDAFGLKGTALLLQGKAEEARDLMADFHENLPYGMGLTAQYAYTLLVSYIEAKDDSGANAFIEMLREKYGVEELPQAITDLKEGKTTVQKIYTEGWGGFEA